MHPFFLSHTESLWLTLTHSAAHYSSPLGITNPHYSPYQSLTNHPSNHAYHAAYQFMTHAPMIHMHYVIAYAHLASIYSSHAFPPSLLGPMQWFFHILGYAPLFTYVFAHSLGSAACSGSPHRWLSLITLLTDCLPISYQSLTKHFVICAYRATAPPVYKPAAKGCKEVSASPWIKRPHSLTLSVFGPVGHPVLA